MKRKIIYTLTFTLCLGLYASSKEFSETGKKEENINQAKVLAITKQASDRETASLFPLVHLFHEIS